MTLMAVLALASGFSGVAQVVDGDTLRIGSARIRLYGIDAPELDQRCGPAQRRIPCGRQAAEALRGFAEGVELSCEAIDVDRYRRIVAICRRGDVDLGAALVGAGRAVAYRRYSTRYVNAEDAAKRDGRGIWASGFQQPATYRAKRRQTLDTPPPEPLCAIKGNVNSKGERIFHIPGDRDYPAARISKSKGERWFCSAAEAAAAGWRPSR